MKRGIALLITIPIILALLCGCDQGGGSGEKGGLPDFKIRESPVSTGEPALDARETLLSAYDRVATASSLDYDLNMEIIIGYLGESVTVYTDGRGRYNGYGTDDYAAHYSYKSSSLGEDHYSDIYYTDGRIYENGYYGKFCAAISLEGFADYLQGEQELSGSLYDSYENILMTESAAGGSLITYSGNADILFDYFESLLGQDYISLDRESCLFKGETELDARGDVTGERSYFSATGERYGVDMTVELSLSYRINSIDTPVSVIIPENDASYTEISDIRIPGLLFGAYDELYNAYSVHAVRTEKRGFDHEGGYGALFTETNEIKLNYEDSLCFSAAYNGEINGDAWRGGQYYDGATFVDDYNGEITASDEHTLYDLWNHITYFYTEYYPYPEDIRDYVLTETEDEYIIDYAYYDYYADYDVDYYYAYLYDIEDVTLSAQAADYSENRGRAVVDKDTGRLAKHEVFIQAAYVIDGQKLSADMYFCVDVLALADVTVDPAPEVYDGGNLL